MTNWQTLVNKLKRFQQIYGHCQVPLAWQVDPLLSQWVINIRQAESRLPSDIRAQLLEIGFDFKADDTWNQMIEQLKTYVQQFGHGYVSSQQEHYQPLFQWLHQQRQAQSWLTPTQIEQLDALGFDWEVLNDDRLRWQIRYEQLVAFYQQVGHTQVPEGYSENPTLADWVAKQRQIHKQGKLAADRFEQLQRLGFLWSEDIKRLKEQRWQQRYEQLCAFIQEQGSLDESLLSKQHYTLYLWVQSQRVSYQRELIKPARKQQLEAIDFPFQKGDYAKERWEARFEELQRYQAQHGDCQVTLRTAHETLVHWVCRQRQYPDMLSEPQRDRLNALGFRWANTLFPDLWQQQYQELLRFQQQNGHCQVPKSDKQLYGWIQDQKKARQRMPDERRRLLDALPGFKWANELLHEQLKDWDKLLDQFIALQKHNPQTYLLVLKQHPALQHWVDRQLHNKDKLSDYKRQRLNATDFPWVFKQQRVDQLWECYYRELVCFKQQYGHCLVRKEVAQYRKLASWVANQKQMPLSAEKRAKLDAIDFPWSNQLAEDNWQQRWQEALAIKQQYGYLKVSSQCPLGSWLYQQRKHEKKLSLAKRQQLEQLGLFEKVKGM